MAATPVVVAGAAEVMNAFQASMRQFLDYQARSQEQRHILMQQFLQTQAGIVQAYLQGAPAAPLSAVSSQLSAISSVSVAPAPAPAPMPVAPPAPIALEPSRNGASHPEPAPVVESVPSSNGADLMAMPASERAERLKALLLELVSDRTGYPVDMLEMDHNMEADLGIDSIKRTEIFGGLRDRLGFHGEAYEKEEYYIKLGKLRTLREVLDWLTEETAPSAPAPVEGESNDEVVVAARISSNGEDETLPAHRLGIEVVLAPLVEDSTRPPRDREVVLVTDGPSGRARKLFALLRGLDYDLAFVRHSSQPRVVSAGNYEADLLSLEGVKQLRGWLEQHHGKLTTLCHLLPLDPGIDVAEEQCIEVRSLFHLASGFSLDLLREKGTVLGVTGMGGTFGVGGPPWQVPPGHAGMIGFLKSLAREWPEVHVKVVDVDPDIDDPRLLAQILAELQTADRKTEVGYGPQGRSVLEVVHRPVQRSPEPMIELDSESTILVTGGARGITAAICAEMGRRYHPRLVLVGRSPSPEPERPETQGLTAAGDLKRALAEGRRNRGETVSPSAIEGEYRALLAARELRTNLDKLRALGVPFRYHSLDVRDEVAFAALVRSVYQEHGKIDGVIHAAGLLGDSLLVGKSGESFDRIFDTKVKPALVLTRELQPESLRFLAFFSSVSARFGNIGQTDYAAANEVLNKLAERLDRAWPARVFSVGWGPWDEVGMARPERMSAEYLATVGFAHMPVEEGCSQFLDEIAYGHQGDAELLIFRPLGAGPSESAYAEAAFHLRAGKR
jgi:NAD(P)-dependent dehydrogenase (short-subunit alcohol dehydrogenase family)